jgi:hypothetical protein
MPPVLTMGSQGLCAHGGKILLDTSNALLYANDFPVLLESDIHTVVGCPFTVGTLYTPCVTVEWEAGAESLAVNGVGVLVSSSIGTCLNAASAPQGLAVMTNPAPSLEAI